MRGGHVRRGDIGGRGSSWSILLILVLVVVVTGSGWCWQRSARNAREKDSIAEALNLQAGMVVADVGGGNGDGAKEPLLALSGTSKVHLNRLDTLHHLCVRSL